MGSERPPVRPLQKPGTENWNKGQGSGRDRRKRSGSTRDVFTRWSGQVLA